MMIDLIPDAPECLADAKQWRPLSYCEHFLGSGFKDRELAVAAYEHAPARYRAPFEAVIAALDQAIPRALAEIEAAVGLDEERTRHLCADASRRLQALIEGASAIIHGHGGALTQSEIDALVEGTTRPA
jgi:hypothetical protein